MNGRDIIQALHSGKRVYSSAMISTSPLWPNFVKQAGVDFVFVDTEHTPIDRQTLSAIPTRWNLSCASTSTSATATAS